MLYQIIEVHNNGRFTITHATTQLDVDRIKLSAHIGRTIMVRTVDLGSALFDLSESLEHLAGLIAKDGEWSGEFASAINNLKKACADIQQFC